MKPLVYGSWSIFALCLLSAPVIAANVEVNWQKPETFRDIRGGNVNQTVFQEQVIKELSSHFTEVAREQLPEVYSLYITVTDVDLAGDVEYFFGRFFDGVRVVRDYYFPSISFDYKLIDSNNRIIKSGSENIKDMGFAFSGLQHVNSPPFNYEKQLIDDWFEKTFGKTVL